jgi:surface polysaccharide O-acyltransferase-like enzyme
MNNEQTKKIIDRPLEYDESKESFLRSMTGQWFGKKMRFIMINTYVWGFIFLVPLIISVVQFFKTEQTKFQIMYAAVFVCCVLNIGFVKVLAWVMLQRNDIKREIKRLELRLAGLAQKLDEDKSS